MTNKIDPLSITDLDYIVNMSKLAKLFEGLEQEDGDGGDRDEEGEECEI